MSAPLKMRWIVKYVAAAFVLLASYIGIRDVLQNFEENGCMMTYMFQLPQYIKVKLPDDVNKKFPKYRLYVYGEGQYATDLRNTKQLNGIPVLFIPGNAGSHKQVRSLGSVALQKAESTSFHFNYFAVDFNEDLSAVFGGYLWDHTEFTHHCIKQILTLYKKSSRSHDSIILVGHSMGGIVARALFTLPNFDSRIVNTIITQATPHIQPVVNIDRHIASFYDTVNSYWQENANTTLKHVTIVSTGGSFRDYQVRNGLTSLSGIFPESRSVSVSTSTVPWSWVSTDHLCAVWCKQMTLLTKRAMFDIIDSKKQKVYDDVDYRMQVFKHHFLHNTGQTRYKASWDEEITLEKGVMWQVIDTKVWNTAIQPARRMQYFAIPLDVENVDVIGATSNAPLDNWICGCKLKPNENQCSTCINLSKKGKVIPPLNSGKKLFYTELKDLPGNLSHVILIVPPSRQRVDLVAELFWSAERHLIYPLPGLFDLLISYPESVMHNAAVFKIKNNTVFYSIHLDGLNSVTRAFIGNLLPIKCSGKNVGEDDGSLMTFSVPWSNDGSSNFIRYQQHGNISLKLHTARPEDSDDTAHLHLILHPSCSYTLKLTASVQESLGQFFRFYGLMFPTFIVANMFMALIGQLRVYREDGDVPVIVDGHLNFGQSYKVAPVASLLMFISSLPAVNEVMENIGIPHADVMSLKQQNIWFPALLFVMYTIAIVFVRVQGYLAGNVIKSQGGIVTVVFFSWCPDAVLKLLKVLFHVLSVVAILTSAFFCGTAGIIVMNTICFLKITRSTYVANKFNDNLAKSRTNLIVTLWLIWSWLSLLNGPAQMVWSRNIRNSLILTSDHSKITGVIGCIAMYIILAIDVPINKNGSKIVNVVVYACTVLMMMFSIVSLYRVPYFILVVLSAFAVLHIVELLQQRSEKRKFE